MLVVAGIRGGGRFGAAWHQATLKPKGQTSYDDFIAVSRMPKEATRSPPITCTQQR
ncbi:MAG: prolyl oligopeptidase family serine peptidase [Steroidobacteraceae bacterium]